MEEILIVDGYNIIGAAQDLHHLTNDDLGEARDELIRKLSEYQSYTGVQVYLVFDAHMVPGRGSKLREQNIIIMYTRKNQTADECIEKLVKQLGRVHRQIYVATSDYTEQRVIFGEGALRKSARELLLELENVALKISKEVQQKYRRKSTERFPVQEGLAEILEKWRRGE